MIDFHIQIQDRDGGLDVSSALRYASLAGIRFAGLVVPSDGDFSFALAAAERARRLGLYANVEVAVGVELRHIPPALMGCAVQEARRAGIPFVMAYGESIMDQVEEGTNFAAIEAGVDILSHPGLLDEKAAALAAEKGVALEITSNPVHALTNARVAAIGLHTGCLLVRGSGASSANELTTRSFWPFVIQGAAWSPDGSLQDNLWKTLRESEEQLVRLLMARA